MAIQASDEVLSSLGGLIRKVVRITQLTQIESRLKGRVLSKSVGRKGREDGEQAVDSGDGPNPELGGLESSLSRVSVSRPGERVGTEG